MRRKNASRVLSLSTLGGRTIKVQKPKPHVRKGFNGAISVGTPKPVQLSPLRHQQHGNTLSVHFGHPALQCQSPPESRKNLCRIFSGFPPPRVPSTDFGGIRPAALGILSRSLGILSRR